MARKITSLQDCKIHHHMIILFESMTETNSVSSGLKKCHLHVHVNRRLDLYVMLLYLRPICTNRKRYTWISDKSRTHISAGPGCVKWVFQIRLHLFPLSVAKESWPKHGHHGDLTVWFLKVNNECWCNIITCTKIIRNMLYLFNG